jgi:hypothetical protein
MWGFITALLGATATVEPSFQVQLAFPIALAVVGGALIAGGAFAAFKGLSQDIPTFEKQQPELFAKLQAEAQGKFSGPFIADVAREQSLQRIQEQTFGLAVSQRGVSPALALQQAQAAQGEAAVETAGQAAVLRVQEQLAREQAAREAIFAAEGQERENALQKRALQFQLAGGLLSGGAGVIGAGAGVKGEADPLTDEIVRGSVRTGFDALTPSPSAPTAPTQGAAATGFGGGGIGTRPPTAGIEQF